MANDKSKGKAEQTTTEQTAGAAEQTAVSPEMQALLDKLAAAERRAADAEAKAAEQNAKASNGTLTTKAGEKGGICVYGLQTRPIHLYASQYPRFMQNLPNVIGFILASADSLSWKDRADKSDICAVLRKVEPQAKALAEAIAKASE